MGPARTAGTYSARTVFVLWGAHYTVEGFYRNNVDIPSAAQYFGLISDPKVFDDTSIPPGVPLL